MVKIAVLNTFVFLLGITLGYLFATQQGPDHPVPAISQDFSDTGPGNGTSPETDAFSDALGTPKPASLSQGGQASLAKLIAEMPKPKTATGDGVITGTVQLADGRPLEGVLIRAAYREPPSSEGRRYKKGTGPPKDRPIEAHVLDMIKNIQSDRLTRKEALTDREGKFALSGLADGRYSLSAYLAGYEFSTKSGHSAYNIKPGDTTEYIAKAIITLPVTVVLPDGSSPEKATIECMEPQGSGGARHHSESWHRNDPVIQLTPGRYTMKAACNAEDEYVSEEQLVTLNAGETPAAMTFQLKGRLGIKGKVVFEDKGEVDNVIVGVVQIAQGATPDLNRLKQPDKQDWVNRHNEFAYHFKDLAAGTYLVGASFTHQGKVLVAHVVDVADRMVTQDLLVPPLDPRDYVVVWVLGPDGERLQDVSISAGYRSDSGSSSGGGRVIKKEDGSYWVLHHEPDENRDIDWDAITYTLSVHSQQFGRKEVTYDRRDRSEITVQFTKPAFLTAQVANYAGSGHEGKVSLTLNQVTNDPSNRSRRFYGGMHENKLDAQGRQTFGPMEPGEYELSLHVRNNQNRNMAVDQIALALSPGDNSATVSLPPLYTLVVLVADPQPNARIQIQPTPRRDGWWGGNTRVDQEGRCEFTQLPAGDYILRMYNTGMGKQMRVTVQGDMTIQFEPKEINAMAVEITKEDGYLAQMGFQSGDIIIGIDGKEFKDMKQFQIALMSAMEQESVALLVLRGSRQFNITVAPKKMMDHRNMGGEIEPTAR